MGKQKDFTKSNRLEKKPEVDVVTVYRYTKNRKAKGNMKLERNSVNREKRLSDSSSRQKAIMANNGAQNKKLEEYSKEELVELVKTLRKRKKYGLVWESKPEDVVEQCKKELPVLEEVRERAIEKAKDKPTNLIIEGDNYHALSILNYTHAGKVDVIYIDPPYNTGNQSWKYNNNYVEKDDPWKHTKWVSMMYQRLALAKNLLKKDGALIVAIDDYEVHHLGLLLEEMFPTYERDLVIVAHHPQGAGSETVSRVHEYAFICTPVGLGFKGRKSREEEGLWSLKRSGQGENNWRINRPKQFFAIIVDPKKRKVIGVGPEIPKDAKKYPTGKTKDGYIRIYPIDREGKERCWRYNRSTMQTRIKRKLVEYSSKGALSIRKEVVGLVPVFSVWSDSRYNAGAHGSSMLTKIMGTTNTFQYPKSLWTVYDLIELVHSNTDAIILDFFAGSGTTGHAVLQLNKEDDGSRQFILVTNNENRIAEQVTYPRIKKVIAGVRDLPDITGIPANIRYFKTAFVPKDEVSDDTRRALVVRSAEMICVRENTFEKKYDNKQYKIYTNGTIATGILFDLDAIEDFKKKIIALDLPAHLYVFSLTNDVFADDFASLPMGHKLCPIPESILEVYRKLFT